MADILRTETNDGICVATIDAPPVHVMTVDLFMALSDLSESVANDDDIRVLVLRSADPDFFIAHFDVGAILQMPVDAPAERGDGLGRFHRMCELFRTMPKATICEIDGRVGGGGAELAASFDMRFGSIESFRLNQMEVPLGILPGGSGTQQIPRLVGRGRALEIILGGGDIDAPTAEQWGWLNRALPSADLSTFVDDLAQRIAGAPIEAVALAKQSVLNAGGLELPEGLIEEQFLFQQLLRTPESHRRMQAFLDIGGQTRPGEAEVAELSRQLKDH